MSGFLLLADAPSRLPRYVNFSRSSLESDGSYVESRQTEATEVVRSLEFPTVSVNGVMKSSDNPHVPLLSSPPPRFHSYWDAEKG